MKSRIPKSLKMAFEFDFKLKNTENKITNIRFQPIEISSNNIVSWSSGKGSVFRAETLCVQRGTGFETRREHQP